MFCVLWFYYSLSSLKQQAQLKLKIYVEVNTNSIDFMEGKYGIDTSADTNGIKLHNLDFGYGCTLHVPEAEFHST